MSLMQQKEVARGKEGGMSIQLDEIYAGYFALANLIVRDYPDKETHRMIQKACTVLRASTVSIAREHACRLRLEAEGYGGVRGAEG
jgi:hypothetical protein